MHLRLQLHSFLNPSWWTLSLPTNKGSVLHLYLWRDLVHWGQSCFSKFKHLQSRIGAYSKKYWSKPQLHRLFLDQVTNFWPVVIFFFFIFLTPILTCISTLEMLTLATMAHIMSHLYLFGCFIKFTRCINGQLSDTNNINIHVKYDQELKVGKGKQVYGYVCLIPFCQWVNLINSINFITLHINLIGWLDCFQRQI